MDRVIGSLKGILSFAALLAIAIGTYLLFSSRAQMGANESTGEAAQPMPTVVQVSLAPASTAVPSPTLRPYPLTPSPTAAPVPPGSTPTPTAPISRWVGHQDDTSPRAVGLVARGAVGRARRQAEPAVHAGGETRIAVRQRTRPPDRMRAGGQSPGGRLPRGRRRARPRPRGGPRARARA